MKDQQLKFSSLSPKWQVLVRKMQDLNFGLLINLKVFEGEPEMLEDFSCVSCYKFPSDNSPRPESMLGEFVLSEEVCQFIDTLQEICCGNIPKVKISNGLPVHMEVSEY